jgi:hypothetical protein
MSGETDTVMPALVAGISITCNAVPIESGSPDHVRQ